MAKEASFTGAVTDSAGKVIGEAVGHAVVTITTEFGKEIVAYWQRDRDTNTTGKADTAEFDAEKRLPPYAIVGIGRCGTHVSAELARILINGRLIDRSADRGVYSTFSRFFGNRDEPSLPTPRPMLVVGDIDETTFDDLEKVLDAGEQSKISSTMRRLHYKPLAQGGAGHVPAFGEFLTRGLMLLSPYDKSQQARPWAAARQYLIESCSGGPTAPRLVFYIFSAGGGTGSGAAAELVRTQRVSINLSNVTDPELYITSLAVIPQGLIGARNRRHLINTGRLFVQYLSELNLKLDDPGCYIDAQDFRFSYFTSQKSGKKDSVKPWDSLGVISNELLIPLSEKSHDKAERFANRYIAQQVFSMAASQVRAQREEEDNESPKPEEAKLPNIEINNANFSSTRLDPRDLKTALRGPYAIGFAAMNSDSVEKKEGIDRLFLRAIGLPEWDASSGGKDNDGLINGLSVAPDEPPKYSGILSRLTAILDGSAQSSEAQTLLTETDLRDLQSIPLFGRCPRVVFVLGYGREANIKSGAANRICELLSWIMPSLNEPRYAVVQHAGQGITLSIFIQSSVVLCPEIKMAIRAYIKLCWARRGASSEEFTKELEDILTRPAPISTEEVEAWLGREELYGKNVDGFDSEIKDIENKWTSFVEGNVDEPRRAELLKHSIRDCMLRPPEIAAALRFLNYVHNFKLPDL